MTEAPVCPECNKVLQTEECRRCEGTGERRWLFFRRICYHCGGDAKVLMCPDAVAHLWSNPSFTSGTVRRRVRCPVCRGRGALGSRGMWTLGAQLGCEYCHGSGGVDISKG